MKITKLEHLHADAGQRNFDFLKISTDEGVTGWSEYNESFGGLGVSAVIDGLASQVLGKDPRAYEALVTLLYAVRRQAAGGVVRPPLSAVRPRVGHRRERGRGAGASAPQAVVESGS